jgi:hypothetical protein
VKAGIQSKDFEAKWREFLIARKKKSKQKQKISATRLEQRRLAAELYLRHWGKRAKLPKATARSDFAGANNFDIITPSPSTTAHPSP